MNFNPIAPFYETLARLVFGNEHRRAEAFFLPAIPAGSRVLLVGGGAGHLLLKLLETRNPAAVAFVEPSAAMRRLASARVKRLSNAPQVAFLVHAGELAGQPPFDALLTPYVLDLFSDEQARNEFLPPLLAALSPGARWVFTDFVSPQNYRQALLISVMYAFFRAVAAIPTRQLPDYDACFVRFGFVKTAVRRFAGGMIEGAVLEKVSGKRFESRTGERSFCERSDRPFFTLHPFNL